ncbi:Trypsin Inhibitor like cysteine rich domain family protein [Acanthocheilonema viteae]
MFLVVPIFFILAIFCITVDGRPKCGSNEEWVPHCASGCELDCDDVEPILCYKKCFPPRCQCKKKGDFRRNKDGKCVPLNECPLWNSSH